MHIGIFGGSFNPPHVCHVLATVWVYETRPVEEIWWVPTYEHAFDKELESYEHRRQMCEFATEKYPYVRVDGVERELGGRSHTIDTVRKLEEDHTDADFSLIVGSDILEETDDWKQWDALMERVDLIVVGRDEHASAGASDVSAFALPDVSSTRARRALSGRQREWLREWIPADVREYIEREDLYRES